MVVLEQLVDVVVLVDARFPKGFESGKGCGHAHSLAPEQPAGNHVPCKIVYGMGISCILP